MTYMLGKASVEDFDEWQSKFEEYDDYRTEHGQRGYQVLQSVEDPNELVVLFDWDDAENARALFASEEMRERLAAAGVKGQPETAFYEKVDEKSA